MSFFPACIFLMNELERAIGDIGMKMTIETGSYRVDPSGNQNRLNRVIFIILVLFSVLYLYFSLVFKDQPQPLPEAWEIESSKQSPAVLFFWIELLFWIEVFDLVPGIWWSHFSSSAVAVPDAPIIAGITLAFTFPIFL